MITRELLSAEDSPGLHWPCFRARWTEYACLGQEQASHLSPLVQLCWERPRSEQECKLRLSRGDETASDSAAVQYCIAKVFDTFRSITAYNEPAPGSSPFNTRSNVDIPCGKSERRQAQMAAQPSESQ